jgi:arginase
MDKYINFSGLGFDIGQMKRGLMTSPVTARNYFSIFKNAGLEIIDCGDLNQDDFSQRMKFFSENDLNKMKWDKYHQAYLKTILLLKENTPLVNWGGDHSVAISSVGAFKHCYMDGYVIWIDAHADLNLPCKSLSGNLHGMPMAILLNLDNVAISNFKWITHFLDPKKLIYVGLRDLDPFEKDIISLLKINSLSFEDIQKNGICFAAKKIVEIVKDNPVHISFDIDSVDPYYAPSTGVPVEKGFTPFDLEVLGSVFFQRLNIRSVDVVEVNPCIGTGLEVDQSYITAFNFLKSVFTNINLGDKNESMGKRNQAKRFNEMEWSL